MSERSPSYLSRIVRFCLEERLVVLVFVLLVLGATFYVAPFDWKFGGLPRDPVAVDAIPDLGENQQIVFTQWPGRSPQDVENQVTYPLTVALLGVAGVRTVRSSSMFGFSTVYVIFEEGVEFYWSRSRILEKLASLPTGTLPEGVQPALGPDATPLGQVFWYTLEGRDPDGHPCPGWDLQELRSVQDWIVRYALAAAPGISEIASVGGYVQEYQIDVDPDAMRAHGIALQDVFTAVRMSNLDVGARTIEINRVEYMIRGLGFVDSLEDLELTVVGVNENVPIYVRDVAHVALGPALRRGALDKAGAEAVGGVAVVRHGSNPLEAIGNLKAEIAEMAPGLPAKAVIDPAHADRTTLEEFGAGHGFTAFDGAELDHDSWTSFLRTTPRDDWPTWVTLSQVTIVPFYDRTGLIHETLATLESALLDEILVTIVVVILMLANLRSSILVSGLLPLAVGITFVLMKLFAIDANIVALAGIAIAIGTMVDVGIVLCENILERLAKASPDETKLEVVHAAASEVAGAVLTAIATTVVGFLPVFVMIGAEGKLFRPLAFTKTFALVAAVVVAICVLPPAALLLFSQGKQRRKPRLGWLANLVLVAIVLAYLAGHWSPLGPGSGRISNFVFVAVLIVGLLFLFWLFHRAYPRLLAWALAHKPTAMLVPAVVTLLGLGAWLGTERMFAFVPEHSSIRKTVLWQQARAAFPGLGKEFMPPLDEGSYLFMPSMMAHASIGEALDVLQFQDRAIAAIPEVASVVGKIGRADSALDPAPIGMVETVINYHPEYVTDEDGTRRQWRDHIHSPSDIWNEIVAAASIPGTTSAPELQPIAARLVMLQSGMRAPMGVKVRGSDLESIEAVGLEIERILREVPGVKPEAVFADRIVGKPYLEIDLDREALARHGLHIRAVQEVIEVAIGGKTLTTTVEGRERYPVRVRYSRELRDDLDELTRIVVPTSTGAQIPLGQLAEIRYTRGPQAIKSEDTFLVGYVIFDRLPGWAEVDVVENCKAELDARIVSGELQLPPGVLKPVFSGTYENQVRAQKTLSVVLPLALIVIFLILHLQFRAVSTTLIVWSGVVVAWAGGFLLLWAYGKPWFLDFEVFGTSVRELFQIGPKNLSVAVWVGFLALFGIATDDGVVMGTYLRQRFESDRPTTVTAIREATLAAGQRRIRPCLMTTATTLLALLPVLTSTGRGADILIPMAIPVFGGMVIAMVSMFVVPVLFCWVREAALSSKESGL